MNAVIESLRRHRVGQLYWLNLCAQLSERAIDATIVYEALATAHEKYYAEYARKTGHDQDEAILVALIAEACRTDQAMVANNRTRPLTQVDIDSLNTILSGRTLWDKYLELEPAAQKMRLRNVASMTGALPTLSDEDVGSAVLKECWGTGKVDLKDLFASGAKQTLLRTRARRFWAGVPDQSRPSDPGRLALMLGIMGMGQGTWVVELTYEREQLLELLGEQAHEKVHRPSALCPNDMEMPRFRSLRSAEVGSFVRDEELEAYGMTVDLHDWTGTDNGGLSELICPALEWREGTLPRIKLLGQIGAPPSDPQNLDFANFLRATFRLSPESEQEAIRYLFEATAVQ